MATTVVLCETLTTRMLIESPLLSTTRASPAAPGLVVGLALLVVGQDLQLLAEIDLPDVDRVRHDEDASLRS